MAEEMMDVDVASDSFKTPSMSKEMENGRRESDSTKSSSSRGKKPGKRKGAKPGPKPGSKKKVPKKAKTTHYTEIQKHEEQEEEWAVERILDKRTENGAIKYFIKWEHWPDQYNTWEPEENLGNCNYLVAEYEARLAAAAEEKRLAKLSISSKKSKKLTSTAAVSTPLRNGNGVQSYKLNESHTDYPESEVSSCDSDIDDVPLVRNYSILINCPEGKTVAKIHAVTVVDGFLSHLVQWNEKERSKSHLTNGHQRERLPQSTEKNTNVVRARAMNEKFPQEVIKFYQEHVKFNVGLTSKEEEAKKAAQALLKAKEREAASSVMTSNANLDDDKDDAEKEILRSNRKNDKFDANVSDLSSTSESEVDDDTDTTDEEGG